MRVPGSIQLEVDAEPVVADVPVGTTLAELLRDRLGRHATRTACGEGACGACTVLLDGAPTASCSLLAHDAHGRAVTTAEAPDELVTRVRGLFDDARAYQCGYCTSGFVMTIVSAVVAGACDAEDIAAALDGNYCRCGAYPEIEQVVAAVAQRLASDGRGAHR